MDSGNMTDTSNEGTPPVDTVVVDTEITEVKPQTEATEKQEVYVEVEDDQQEQSNSTMNERQTKAAWKDEKRKRKERTAQANEEKARADRLEDEVKELRSQVSNVTRGGRPDPYDFDSTDEFYTALEKWQSHGKPDANQPEKKTVAKQIVLSDEQEWHMHQSEEKLKATYSDYDNAKSRVKLELEKAFSGSQDIMEQIYQVAHTYGADPAKAILALDKIPGKMTELVNAPNLAQVGKILRDLGSKVKVRGHKSIDSKPEPNINGGGPVNHLQKEVETAEKKYFDKPTQQNHQLLTAARKRIKDEKGK